ncbi:hypothetical protein QJQ45_025377 [Haematococcus lacustris]|nr:hypothetical protein QJQ45_025377 [Haematococcus lacustris]
MLGRTLPSAIPTSKCCWGVPVARWSRQPRCVLRAATLLERDAAVQAEEDIVQAKDWQLETVMDWDSGFAEYAQATQSLEDLTNLQQELLANVETFDTLVAPAPQPRVQRKAASPDSTAEARRAKRKAARAGGSAAVQSAVADAPPPATDLEASIESLAGMRQQLDSLILHPAQPAEEVKPQPQSRTKRSAVPAASPSQTAGLQHDAEAQMASLDLEREAEHTARRKHKLRASRNSRAVSSVSEPDAAHAASRPSRSSNADGTTQFMQMATSTKVLGSEEQKELAVMVKDYLGLKTVQRQLANILKRPPTAAECARALKSDLREYQARFDAGQQAKALMLKTNYRLVISVVKKYQNRGISMQDLITEGMQGLLKGVEKFEPEKGFRFSTYAHWWIRQAVSRALQDQSRAVRLPSHIHEMVSKLSATKYTLQKDLGRAPTIKELADATGIPASKIPELQEAGMHMVSLESPAGGDEEGGVELKDTLEDGRAQPDEVFVNDMVRQNIQEVMRELNPREAEILSLRLGLNGKAETTLEEIGAMFNLTRERVRQIEVKAVQRLRALQWTNKNVMQEYQGQLLMDSSEAAGRQSRGTRKS